MAARGGTVFSTNSNKFITLNNKMIIQFLKVFS